MLIAVFALFSWIFTFDSRDGNDEVKKVKKIEIEQIVNKNTGIIVCKNVNNNFLYQGTDSYRLNLYYLNDNIGKKGENTLYSIVPCVRSINESKKNKTLTGVNYINKNQELFLDFLDNTSKFTVGIKYKFNPFIEVLEEEYFKEKEKK